MQRKDLIEQLTEKTALTDLRNCDTQYPAGNYNRRSNSSRILEV